MQAFNIFGDLPAGLLRRAQVTEVATYNEAGSQASAVIVIGAGTLPTLDPDTLFHDALRPILAFTHTALDPTRFGELTTVRLIRPPRPEELDARAAAERRELFRRNWIVAVSLLVTVMGIANAMLMSVTERFREIGTMKCLGALSSFIRRQFLIESIILGSVGSFIGAILGALIAILYAAFSYGPTLVFAALGAETIFLATALPLAFLAGIGLSILAALYPATVAARMLPATALRTNI